MSALYHFTFSQDTRNFSLGRVEDTILQYHVAPLLIFDTVIGINYCIDLDREGIYSGFIELSESNYTNVLTYIFHVIENY